MAQEKPNRAADWLEALRTQAPAARDRLRAWTTAARQDPRLIWRTPAVRLATYGALACILLVVLRGGIGLFAPMPPPDAGPAAESADFHVICGRAACRRHFVIHREFGFDGFPVKCVACGSASGQAARRCHSDVCGGRWVAAVRRGDADACPECGAVFP